MQWMAWFLPTRGRTAIPPGVAVEGDQAGAVLEEGGRHGEGGDRAGDDACDRLTAHAASCRP